MSGLDSATLYGLADSVLSSIETNNCTIATYTNSIPFHPPMTSPLVVSEETIQKLRFLFPEELLTAAFDLVDKESGTLINSPSPFCLQARVFLLVCTGKWWALH